MATVYGDSVAFVGETFTGNLSNLVTPPAGRRLIISGWSLNVSGNSAACQCTIALGANSRAAVKFPISGTVAGSPLLSWTVTGILIGGGEGASLSINGGALGGVLDGVVFVQVV